MAEPTANSYDTNKYANTIFEGIHHVSFICNKNFEPTRYNRLIEFLQKHTIDPEKVSFVCPTYKHLITDELFKKHAITNKIKFSRCKPPFMKRSELSLILNFLAVFKDIHENHSGEAAAATQPIFAVFESDIIDTLAVTELPDFTRFLKAHTTDWEVVHIGSDGDACMQDHPNQLCGYCKNLQHFTEITDPTNPNNTIRKMNHVRRTDSFLFTQKGIEMLLDYMIHVEQDYSMPMDFYLDEYINKTPSFRNYFSKIHYFLQSSEAGIDSSTIQKDIR